MDALSHIPVLLQESIEALKVDPSGIYVDATFGRGGHTSHILKHLGAAGRVIAIDKDWDAIAYAEKHFKDEVRFHIEHGSFAQIGDITQRLGCLGKVSGVLLDLGVSSPQLDEAGRGFSFTQAGPLDMRMNNRSGQSAEQWVAETAEEEMIRVFKIYGEERFAKRIARAIIRAREEGSITDTLQLAEIVKAAHPAWEKHKHPATRVFQAIRIAVNRELQDLEDCLADVIDVLAVGGRLAVVSFHSLEDRCVKQFIQREATVDAGPIELPIATRDIQPRLKKIGKMQKASADECSANPRARSACLRVAEKVR